MSSTPQGEQPGGASPAPGSSQQVGQQAGTQGGPQWRSEWGPGPQAGAVPAGYERPPSPVPRHETHVTGRRIVQYIVDAFLSGIIPGILFGIADLTHGWFHRFWWIVAAVVWVVVMIWYWVLRPSGAGGQTFGMQLMRIRVISKDGGRASTAQLFIRWIFLIVDVAILSPLVAYIVILCSRYRQRIGDHAAKTLVVKERVMPGAYTWQPAAVSHVADPGSGQPVT